MKQILQSLKTGDTRVADVPAPRPGAGEVLVATSHSVISAGTERMLVEFGKAGLLAKARQQPDKVQMVLDKIRTDGLLPTVDAVRSKLDEPLPLGYCNAGLVVDTGPGVTEFSVGDRVASNGHHAELVAVPEILCARVPDGVRSEDAAFTVAGAIALQGIRLVEPTLGEAVVVTGLGLIGLLSVQLLRAHGCRVLGIDLNPARLELAREFGAETVDLSAGEDPVSAARLFSRGRGVDAVVVAASTKSSEPIHQAALMCRKRGRIVLVGVTGLELSRDDFYEKELTFQVSCSYGPGRYDPAYEEKGQDYPIGFVRWTEQRNFEAVLDMLAAERLRVAPLISHRYPLEDAEEAYALLTADAPSLGIVLDYPSPSEWKEEASRDRVVARPSAGSGSRGGRRPTEGRVAFIGAGNYARRILIPAFAATGARLVSVASRGGVSGTHVAEQHGFEETTTDPRLIFSDDRIDAVVVATRHDSHAGFVIQALEAGKSVFVEKPLCLTLEELDAIERSFARAGEEGDEPLLMVGFNRRFAPQVEKIRELTSTLAAPRSLVMTVNAGSIPDDHWLRDPEIGGGRIIGEGCHFVDLLRFVAGSPIEGRKSYVLGGAGADTASLQMTFRNGSIGSVHYFANGSRKFPKERLEVFSQGRVLQLDNFRKLRGFGWPEFGKMNLWRQDKGQEACAAAFMDALRSGGPSPIPFQEIVEVSRVSIDLATDAVRPAPDA